MKTTPSNKRLQLIGVSTRTLLACRALNGADSPRKYASFAMALTLQEPHRHRGSWKAWECRGKQFGAFQALQTASVMLKHEPRPAEALPIQFPSPTLDSLPEDNEEDETQVLTRGDAMVAGERICTQWLNDLTVTLQMSSLHTAAAAPRLKCTALYATALSLSK